MRTHAESATEGIQETIDQLPDGGGVVELEAKTYELRAPIMMRTGVTLRGQGASTVLTVVEPLKMPLVSDMPAGSNELEVDGSHINDLRPGDSLFITEPHKPGTQRHFGYWSRFLQVNQITGNKILGTCLYGEDSYEYRATESAVALRAFPAIFINRADDVTIADLTIDGKHNEPLTYDGVTLTDFMLAAISHCFSQCCRIRDVTIRNWPSDGICGGGKVADLSVTGCIVEHCAGIGLHTGGGVKEASWIGNTSRYNESGFLFCQGNRHVICAHNQIHHNRRQGIWGLGSTDRYCSVVNNHVHHNGEYGIEAKGSIGNIIQGNVIRNNSQSGAGRYAAIYLHEQVDTQVSNNLCVDDQEPPTQLIDIDTEPLQD